MPDIIHEDEYAALVSYHNSHQNVQVALGQANLALNTLVYDSPSWQSAMQMIWGFRNDEENGGGPPPLQD